MSEDYLEYSSDASNIMNKFYSVDKLLYVEGEDDILFWNIVFKKIASLSIEVQDLGGSERLDRYIQKIVNNEINALAARDSDYFKLLNMYVEHPNVLYTYGYSIENTLIVPVTVKKLITNLSKMRFDESDTYVEWLNQFIKDNEQMIYHDIANMKLNRSCKVLGDNCTRFMCGNGFIKPSKNNIKLHLANVSKNFTQSEVSEVIDNIDLSNVSLQDITKGHYIFSAVHNFIRNALKQLNKKINLSNDALYYLYMGVFELTFNDKHPHFEYYKDSITNVQQ